MNQGGCQTAGGIGANQANPGRYFFANMAMALHLIEQGRIAGLVSRYYSVGAFAAFKAEKIMMDGVPAETIPVETLSRMSYLIRMETARRLRVFPPVGLLRIAEPV